MARLVSAAVIVAALAVMPAALGARAQDLEPRAYSAAPIGTNFLIAGYSRTTGSVSTDPSLPVTGVQAERRRKTQNARIR